MFTAFVLVVTHVVAAAAGAFGWVHGLSPLVAKFSASRVVTNAQKLVAKAEADAKALEAAKATVAAAPAPVVAKPVATGATGATGA